MGVDLQTWCETLRASPLRFKFDGLDGFHDDVREAAVCDEQFMDMYMEKEHEHLLEALEREIEGAEVEYLDRYREFLHDNTSISQLGDKHVPDDLREAVEFLERLDPCRITEPRCAFVQEYVGPAEWAWECIRDSDPEWLLEQHPPVAVWNEAYDSGFPVDHVVYVCPSCGRQAMTIDELEDNGYRHYCSLCGSEYLAPHDFRDPHDLALFASALEVDLWPFGRPAPLKKGDVVVIAEAPFPAGELLADAKGASVLVRFALIEEESSQPRIWEQEVSVHHLVRALKEEKGK